MKEIILHGIFNALWILGVWNLFRPDEMLGEIGDFFAGSKERGMERILPWYISRPIFECAPCMASFHGVLWWLLFHPFPLILLPIYIVCLSGFLKVVTILVLNKDY